MAAVVSTRCSTASQKAISSFMLSIYGCTAASTCCACRLEERPKLLTEALRKVEYPVIQSIPFNVKPAEVIRAAKELELEGVIAKRNGSMYEHGRRSVRG